MSDSHVSAAEPIYNLVVSSTPPKKQEPQGQVKSDERAPSAIVDHSSASEREGRISPNIPTLTPGGSLVPVAVADAPQLLGRKGSFASSSSHQGGMQQVTYPQVPYQHGLPSSTFSMSSPQQSLSPAVVRASHTLHPAVDLLQQQQQRFPPTPPVVGYPFPRQISQYGSPRVAPVRPENQTQVTQGVAAQYYPVPTSGYPLYYNVYEQPYPTHQQTSLQIPQHPGYIYPSIFPSPYPQTASITPTTPLDPGAASSTVLAQWQQVPTSWSYPQQQLVPQPQQQHASGNIYMVNAFTGQQIQPSHSLQSAHLASPGTPAQISPVPPPYTRRHSHPVRARGTAYRLKRSTSDQTDPTVSMYTGRWNQHTLPTRTSIGLSSGASSQTYNTGQQHRQPSITPGISVGVGSAPIISTPGFGSTNVTTGQHQFSQSSRSSSVYTLTEEGVSNQSSASSSFSTGTATTPISTKSPSPLKASQSHSHDSRYDSLTSQKDPSILVQQPHNLPILPRGPPRKPKQSGHALWVGNLPADTTVIELKDYFSNSFTHDIESVFLISKSNCAFINYKSEAACSDAMAKFHDSRFKGARLVCRLRRNQNKSGSTTRGKPQSASATGAISVPKPSEYLDGTITSTLPLIHDCEDHPSHVGSVSRAVADQQTERSSNPGRRGPGEGMPDRTFIVKSLTVEDLDLSVKNGVWATQSHNEEVLNHAFETSRNVYLVFSANKSGEYYGYARMASRIDDTQNPAATAATTTDVSPRTEETPIEPMADEVEGDAGEPRIDGPSSSPARLPKLLDLGLLKAIRTPATYTPATAHAPPGRVIDDSARGTIFWEVVEEGAESGAVEDGEDNQAEFAADSPSTSPTVWGKSFRVEWISTMRIPFYRTRGLRNLWNLNREVKIARDGTEVESNVAKKLLGMFHKGGYLGEERGEGESSSEQMRAVGEKGEADGLSDRVQSIEEGKGKTREDGG